MRLVFDIETMKKNKRYSSLYKMGIGYKDKILIGCYDGIKYNKFECFNDFFDYIYSRKEKTIYLYAHNGGKFDFLYLLENLEKYKKSFYSLNKIKVINSNFLCNIKLSQRKNLSLRDSFLLLPKSLDSLLNSFNISTKKIKIDYNKWYSLDIISDYLYNDVIGLYQLLNIFEIEINKMIHKYKINLDSCLTLASLSFKLLNKNYLNGGLRNFMTKEQENFIRKGYYGARVEVYKKYGYNLYYYDVNSLYPYVMAKYDYPFGRFFETNNPNPYIDHYLGMVKATVNYPKNKICLLPYRQDKKLYFPYGKWTGVFTSIELQEAIKQGCKVKLHYGIFWTHKKKIFTDFVNDIYEMKKNNKGAKREIAKLILNSSYGKFGQKRLHKKIIDPQTAYELCSKINEYEVLGNDQFFCKDIEDYSNRYINPVYSAFITAYARIEMFKKMKEHGEDHIYYSDTDCIITDVRMKDSWCSDTEIGKFSEECKTIEKGIFLSTKLYGVYLIDGTVILKARGLDKEVLKQISFNDFKKLQFRSYKYSKTIMYSFLQGFKRKDSKNIKNYVFRKKENKEIKANYQKRKLIGNDYYSLSVSDIMKKNF